MTGTSDSTHLRLPLTVRVAALLFLFLGAAFGASVPFVLAYLDRHGELPMMFGFQKLAGPFERLGPAAFKALGWTFVGVCAADVVAGLGLWRGRRWGARLGLATSPVAFALGVGFRPAPHPHRRTSPHGPRVRGSPKPGLTPWQLACRARPEFPAAGPRTSSGRFPTG